MIIIQKNIDIDINILKVQLGDIHDKLIFDIETTGFSYRKNMIYLIGCIHFTNNQPTIIQWLAENENDEYALLYEFIKFCNNYSCLIHYNGLAFDIPFITRKAKLYNIKFDSFSYESIDIYRLIKPCKHILGLQNCKLKTVEKYMNIHRKDIYTGGELIKQYIDFQKTNSDTIKNNLLQHNEDDIIGLYNIISILQSINFYNEMKNNNLSFSIKDTNINDTEMTINILLSNCSPITYSYRSSYHFANIEKNSITIKLKLYEGELKYFFDNYKDYYYILSEDEAVHKQIAKYIDKSNKIKASSENCYLRKRGIFIPLYTSYTDTTEKFFYVNKKDTIKYMLVTENITCNTNLLTKICNHILSLL
ncbi:MAG: ribonuclease H-like domain-containing protein [Vallitalea sp.]|jgi:uncharacterized protein YprB with RNaseH-like and TPR domain|nr:ribonuclease H-like domain-containing protein [Vallitalea sp.]